MKKAIVSYTMTIDCQQVVIVPNDFEFTTFDPEGMIEELEDEIGYFEPNDIQGDDVNDVDFEFVYDITLLDD